MKQYRVPSYTEEGKRYIVRQFEDGDYRCDCPNFIFKEYEIGVCNHIIKVIKYIRYVKKGKKDTGVGTNTEKTQS